MATTGFSQNENELKHTFSFNVNFILDQWISKSSDPSIFQVEPDHLVLAMFKIRSKNADWRIGAGGTFRKDIEPLPSFGFPTIPTNANVIHRGYVLQLGVQGDREVWKNWDFIFGGDLLLQHRKFRTEIERTFEAGNIGDAERWSQYKQNSIGLSGFMGVQFFITERIALSTELSLVFSQTFNSEDSESDASISLTPDDVDSSLKDDKIDRLRLTTPLTLYVNFRL